MTECQGRRKFALALQIQFAGQGDVSVGRFVKFPLHLKIAREVRPSVASSYVAARQFREWNRRPQYEPRPLFLGSENPATPDVQNMSVVVPTAGFQVRCTKNVEAESIHEIIRAGDASFLQQAWQMRMSDYLFND